MDPGQIAAIMKAVERANAAERAKVKALAESQRQAELARISAQRVQQQLAIARSMDGGETIPGLLPPWNLLSRRVRLFY